MCYDDASCAAQPPAFTSSATAARSVFLGGIFATGSSLKNIQFGDANVVWVSYCTSDAWAGDVGPTAAALSNATAAPGAWAGFSGGFRGQRILRATLQTMQKSLTFGSADNTQLLLGGCTPGVVRSGRSAAAWARARRVREYVTQRLADALARAQVYNLDIVAATLIDLGIKTSAHWQRRCANGVCAALFSFLRASVR
jgi:hypothetical protein